MLWIVRRRRRHTAPPERTAVGLPLVAVVRAPDRTSAHQQARRPFGAVLIGIADGAVVAGAHNTAESGDTSEHAEMNLLRQACAAGIHLPGRVLVATAEPCAMCSGALLWCGVRAVAYGTSVSKLIRFGLPQIDLSFVDISGRCLRMPRPAVACGVRSDLTDPLHRGLPPVDPSSP